MIEISESNRFTPKDSDENTNLEKRIHDIDKQIGKLMDLYQNDAIPPDLLGENINKLYSKKTTLQSMIEPVIEDTTIPFDLAKELLEKAAQMWDFADMAQKRRILQSLVKKIIIDDDKVNIEWAFGTQK